MHHLVAAGLASANLVERRRNLVVTLRKRCPAGFDLSPLAQPDAHPVAQLTYMQGHFVDSSDFDQLKIHLQTAHLFLEEGKFPHTDSNKCWANGFVGIVHFVEKRSQIASTPDFKALAACAGAAFPFLNAFATWHQTNTKHPFYSIVNTNLVSEIYVKWGEAMKFLSYQTKDVDHAIALALQCNPENQSALRMRQEKYQVQGRSVPPGDVLVRKVPVGNTSFLIADPGSIDATEAATQAEIHKNPDLQVTAAKEILTQTPKSHQEMCGLIKTAGLYIHKLSYQDQQDVINKICDTLRKIELDIATEGFSFYQEAFVPLLQIKVYAKKNLARILRKRIYESIKINRDLTEIQRLDTALVVAHALGMENLVEEVGFLRQQFLECGVNDEPKESIKMQRTGLNGLYFVTVEGIQKKVIYNRVSQCRAAYDEQPIELLPDEKAYVEKELDLYKGKGLSADEVRDRAAASVHALAPFVYSKIFCDLLREVDAVVDIPNDYHIPPNMRQLLKAWDIDPDSELYQHHMAKWQEIHGRKLAEEQKAYKVWLHPSDLSADVASDEVEIPTETKKMQKAQLRTEKHCDPEPAEAACIEKTNPMQMLDKAWECAKDKTGVPLDRLRVVIENKHSAGSGSRCMGHLLETVITIGPDGEKVSTERLLPSPIPLHGPHPKRAQAADFTKDGDPDTLKAVIWHYNQILDQSKE